MIVLSPVHVELSSGKNIKTSKAYVKSVQNSEVPNYGTLGRGRKHTSDAAGHDCRRIAEMRAPRLSFGQPFIICIRHIEVGNGVHVGAVPLGLSVCLIELFTVQQYRKSSLMVGILK